MSNNPCTTSITLCVLFTLQCNNIHLCFQAYHSAPKIIMFVYLHVTLFVPPSYNIIMSWNSAGPPLQMPQIEQHYNVPVFICSYSICSLWSYNAIALQAALHYNVCFSFLSCYNWMFSSSPSNGIILSWHCSIHKYCKWHKVITC